MDPESPCGNPFDFQRGVWTSSASSRAAAEVIIAADWAPIRAFAPIIAADPEAVYGDLLPVLRAADLRIANLECPLTTLHQPVPKSGSVLRGEPAHVQGLTAVPFEIVTLGNNHLFDHGIAAFKETIDLLDTHRIQWLGAGMDPARARRPLVVKLKGLRLALINFSEGEDLTAAAQGPGVFGWEVARVIERVAALRRRADVIVVICHCGVEYIPFPPPYVADAFQRIAAAGAHLIVGHHPHVPQGIAIHHNVPICYSLGNFVFYQESDLFYRKIGYLLKVGLAREGVARLEIIPYRIGPGGLSLLDTPRRRAFLRTLAQISAPLDNFDRITEAWNAFLCRYGKAGFEKEIVMLLERLKQEPLKGAAMFRNRIATMQHNQHWIDALTRIITNTIDVAPRWALEINTRWMTQRCRP